MRWFRTLLILLAVTLVLAPAASAAPLAKSLVWDSYQVFLTIQPNGEVQVLERQTITIEDGVFSFGFAVIPLDKVERLEGIQIREPNGRVYQLVDYSNEPYTYYVNHLGNEVEIRWNFPPAGPGETRTFDLVYTAVGAVRIYDSGDKLQWIAIDNERDFPIREATVVVNLPPGAQFQLIDSAGVRTRWTTSPDRRSVTFVAEEPLSPSDFLEVGVEFTHGVVPAVPPSWQAEVDRAEFYDLNVRPWVNLFLILAAAVLGIGGPLGVYLLWYTRGRDPQVGPVPEYVTEPPPGVRPGLLGTLVDEQADMRDVVATIVDLARRGYLTIEEVEDRGFLGIASQDFVFRQGPGDGSELTPYEKRILKGIFSGGLAKRRLSDLRNRFYKHLPGIQEDLYEDLVRQGFFKRRPDRVRRLWSVLGGVALGMAFMGSIFLFPLAELAGAVYCLVGALFATGVALLVGSRFMPVKTRKGAEAAAQCRAFKTYLERIDRLTDLEGAKDLFERYLPYAIAFGLQQSWVRKFARLEDVPAPRWYIPHTMGRPVAAGGGKLASPAPLGEGSGGLQSMSEGMAGSLQSMSDGLTRMLNSTSRVLSTAPSSSGTGGGGFSSGGFSVGGGGGGGGRGFG